MMRILITAHKIIQACRALLMVSFVWVCCLTLYLSSTQAVYATENVVPNATSESTAGDTIPLTRTNWEETLTIPRFDPRLGILTKIEFLLTGRVEGSARIENLDAAPALVTVEIIADIQLERPDGTSIALASPNAAQTVPLDKFDGVIDFGGPSGATADNIVGIDISEHTVYTKSIDLEEFTGTGLIDLAVRATGRSGATGAGNLGLSFNTLAGASLSVTYLYTQPAILLEKATNGIDADQLPGPILFPGDLVTWTYLVTNVGGTPLEDLTLLDDREGDVTAGCPQTTLTVGEAMTCVVTGIAQQGQYTNTAVVTGNVPSDMPGQPRQVTATDPSHYSGVGEPAIDLEKLTNGEDADQLPGPLVAAGDVVTWTYLVRNIGEIDLENLTLLDDREGDVTSGCPQTTLAVGEAMTCVATDIAQQGQYTNTAVVTGTTPAASVRPNTAVTDSDPSHYSGVGEPAIDLEKLTNGEDADLLPGPLVAAGDVVTWTYLVRNVGEIALENLTLVDDREGDVTSGCPQTTLAVGAAMTCIATGIAQQGQYTNTAIVTGTTPAASVRPNTAVTDSDPSHYVGTALAFCPVNAQGNVILPQVWYLGEGPGDYYVGDDEEQFIIKKLAPFRFINRTKSPYKSTRASGAPERIWVCTGDCIFTKAVEESIGLGLLPEATILHAVMLDDDPDARINLLIANGDVTSPVVQIPEQSLTEYFAIELPQTAVWSFYADDSIGIYLCIVPQ